MLAGEEKFAEDLASRLGSSIKQAEQALISTKTKALRPYSLSVPQYSALMILSYVPGQTAAQLARASNVTQQTMAVIISTLEKRGLVQRAVSPVHSKVLSNTLTDEGLHLVRQADQAARGVEARLSAEFSEQEEALFRSFFERAISTLHRDPLNE